MALSDHFLKATLIVQRTTPGSEDRHGNAEDVWANHLTLPTRFEQPQGERTIAGREVHLADWVAYVNGQPDIQLADRVLWPAGLEKDIPEGEILDIIAIAPQVNGRTKEVHHTELLLRRVA